MTNKRQPEHKSAAAVTHTGRGLLGAIYREFAGKPLPESELCAQCLANANWNDAGGYHELAEQCGQYCRNGHKA